MHQRTAREEFKYINGSVMTRQLFLDRERGRKKACTSELSYQKKVFKYLISRRDKKFWNRKGKKVEIKYFFRLLAKCGRIDAGAADSIKANSLSLLLRECIKGPSLFLFLSFFQIGHPSFFTRNLVSRPAPKSFFFFL